VISRFNGVSIINTATLSTRDFLPKNAILKLYPNPVEDVLSIEISNNVEVTRMTINNVGGNLINESKFNNASRFEIETSELKPGLYFITLYNNKKALATRKIIKK